MLHGARLTISGEWVEAWCGCGWKYNPPEDDGTRLERLRKAQKRGHEHVRGEEIVKLQEAIDTVMDGNELREMTRHNAADFVEAMAVLAEAAIRVVNPEFIDIVFDGPPGHDSGSFVEVENQDGQSISVGEWVHREDDYWVLRFPLGIIE